jgi:hypothetical protein
MIYLAENKNRLVQRGKSICCKRSVRLSRGKVLFSMFMFLSALQISGIYAADQVTVSQKTYRSAKILAPAFSIENRYYKATLVPEMGGRILEFIDKKDGINLVYERGYGGLLDDHGSKNFLPYKLEWLKKEPEEVVVRLTLDAETSYQKTIRFLADRPSIEVTYHCENHGQKGNRMLFRNVVRPGGGVFSSEELYCYSGKSSIVHGAGFAYKAELADMWSALVHRGKKTVVANFFEGDVLQHLYSWRKGTSAVAPTYEFLLNTLKPGHQTDFRYYWMLCHGLPAVDYAHRNFVAHMDGEYREGTLEVKLELIATWTAMPDLKVSGEVLDAGRKTVGTVPAAIIPMHHLDTVVSVPLSAGNIKTGEGVILLVKLRSSTMDQPVIIEKPFPLKGNKKILEGYTRPVRWIGAQVEQKPIPGWKEDKGYTIQPDAGDRKRGYLIFEESGVKAGKHTTGIALDLVQNEPEGFPLHFYSTTVNSSVVIKILAPEGLLLESFIPEGVPEKMWTGESRVGLKLIPKTTFSVKQGEDRILFFRIKSGKVSKGKYTVNIIFTPEGAPVTDVAVNVDIHPIRFPEQPLMVFDANNSVTSLCTKSGKDARNPVWDKERADNFFRDMKDHGIRGHAMSGVSSPFAHYWYNRVKVRETGMFLLDAIKKNPETFRNRTDLPALDFSEWDWFTDQFLRHGMTHLRIQMGSCEKGFMSKHSGLTKMVYGELLPPTDIRHTVIMEWYYREAVRYMKDRGIFRVLAIIDDEIPSEKMAWWVQHAYRAIQMGFEPGVTMSAATIEDDTVMNIISPFMKYWVIGTMSKDMMDLRRAEGLLKPEDRVITYHSSANHWQEYDQMRGRCGLDTAFFDLDACWIQTYDRFYDQRQAVVYPGENGPISSAAWEGARDGLDDGNLLLLARSMIGALPAAEQKSYLDRLEGIVGMREDSLIRFSNRLSELGTVTTMGSISKNTIRPYRTFHFRTAKQRLLYLIEELAGKVPVQKASASFGLGQHPIFQDGMPLFTIPKGMVYAERAATFLLKAAGGLECAAPQIEDVDPKNPYPVFFFGTLAELKKLLPALAEHPEMQDVNNDYPAKSNYIIRFLQKPADAKSKVAAGRPAESMVILVADEEGAERAEVNLINIVTYPRTQYSHWLVK